MSLGSPTARRPDGSAETRRTHAKQTTRHFLRARFSKKRAGLRAGEFRQNACALRGVDQACNTLFELHAGDKKQQVLPRDVQLDVVRDVPLHVDFLRLSNRTEININVPVVFINEEESEALKQGAVLNIVRHQIEVRCLASAIPASLEVDLTGTQIGDSIHISAITLPAGVAPTITDRDFTIVTLAAPTVQAVEEEIEEGEEGEDGEDGEEAAGEEAEGEDG